MAGELEVLHQLSTDEPLQPLLQEQFDPKTFAAHIVQCQMVGEVLYKLTSGIAELDRELYTQVVTHYEDLLSQATGIEALESVLKMMHTRIESLSTAVDRISTKITDPYQKIVSRTAQLSRLQAACDLLRKVIRMLYLIKRVRSQMQSGAREITKVAQTFSEIDALSHGEELTGIEVLDDERAFLSRARREVESQGKKMLIQGLDQMNPAQVGVALQVFHNLGQLASVLVSILTGYQDAVLHEIQNAVDPVTLLQGHTVTVGGRAVSSASANWKASLWTKLEKLANSLLRLYKQMHQLETVLAKKHDPVTQIAFLTTITGSEAHRMLTDFWEYLANHIAVEFATAAKASIVLNQTFELDYSKLLKVFAELLAQVDQLHAQTETEPMKVPFLSLPSDKPQSQSTAGARRQDALLRAFAQFEKAYVSRLLSRLNESVNQMFSSPGRNVPKEDEVLLLVRMLASELQVAGNCVPLALILAKNVAKAIQLFNTKCEQMVLTGKDSLQVSGPPNFSQQRNIAVVNLLNTFETLVKEHTLSSPSVREITTTVLKSSLKQTNSLKINTASLFVDEVQRTMEKMIASMHAENFGIAQVNGGGMNSEPDVPCSGYMKEMLSFASRISQEHLCHYRCQEELRPKLESMSERLMELFVRHVCLIRPVKEGGKMRITSDIAQIELALSPFCNKVSDLGQAYKRLRSLRRLLFLAPENFVSQPAGVGDILPFSYTLNFLFSQAPPELKSPHQLQNWSQSDYCEWMDKHPSEKDRLAFLQATLDSFVKRNKSKPGFRLPAIYSVMTTLLKQAQES